MRALFFSDIHFHLWGKFNEDMKRTKASFRILEFLFKLAEHNKVPLIFGGDMFHDPEAISNELWSLFQPEVLRLFNYYPSVEVYAISGNHDMKDANTPKLRSPSYIRTLSNSISRFKCIDFETVRFNGWYLHGVPYLTHNEGIMAEISKFNLKPNVPHVLLLHTDFQGQKDTSGVEVGRGQGIDESYFKNFKLVMSGHIHKAGRVRKNIYSIGSPNQLRTSDMGGEFGYWILGDDFKLTFKALDIAPEFRYYKEDKERDNFHLWIKEPITEEALISEARAFDTSNKSDIVDAYLEYEGIQSKTKSRYLKQLFNKVEELYEAYNL